MLGIWDADLQNALNSFIAIDLIARATILKSYDSRNYNKRIMLNGTFFSGTQTVLT